MAPQLQVFFISMSLKAVAAQAVVALTVYQILDLERSFFQVQLGWLEEWIQRLGGA